MCQGDTGKFTVNFSFWIFTVGFSRALPWEDWGPKLGKTTRVTHKTQAD